MQAKGLKYVVRITAVKIGEKLFKNHQFYWGQFKLPELMCWYGNSFYFTFENGSFKFYFCDKKANGDHSVKFIWPREKCILG